MDIYDKNSLNSKMAELGQVMTFRIAYNFGVLEFMERLSILEEHEVKYTIINSISINQFLAEMELK